MIDIVGFLEGKTPDYRGRMLSMSGDKPMMMQKTPTTIFSGCFLLMNQVRPSMEHQF